MSKVLMAEVNISEGTDLSVVEKVKEAFLSVDGIEVIDIDSNADHNRTVFTYKGEPENVLEATKKLAAKAVELIDMTKHKGSHPRIGAVDVVPFIPVREITTEEAVVIAKEFGKYLGSLGVPVYFYEDAQEREYRKALPKIRKGQYEALEERMKDEEWYPDEGPKEFNPKAGATVTGARFPLVAFNINLDTEDLEIGKEIVKSVRAAAGGYTYVRAIALSLEEKKQVQVSMNMINYEKTPIHRVFETIKSEASRYNVNIVDTELVGPVPVYAIRDVLDFYLRISKEFSVDQIYS
ncbi:glutamate formiminotransferase [Peptoniphilus asaccharolyticus DSM 20463]|uniref:glutamate formimidoyltransferase n=1 Tax=Peptoniphilus asaccharolyticus DSM 20463 TaxID=573058 RepID=A0A1W1V9Y1_PEPAS|nr:glutamate formimidoyltransferase [Peptoniphilus asaccharolyticus]MBL7575809.1 glutamate formimidoyltransferase [Peptoniphilus asaccharolyticus]SMB89814.1 glutamate formiminotransferase [Peptoniphilus asaccharolyticus DSM 20463]